MSFIMDKVASTVLKNDVVSGIAYKTAITASEPIAPGALQMFCIVYNTLLNDTSKETIRTFIKEDSELSKFYLKYEILTDLCKNEKMDPMIFIKSHEMLVNPILIQLGIDIHVTEHIDELKIALNNNILKIIELIKTNKQKVLSIMKNTNVGGTRKINKKKKKNKRKSKHYR
jgi:hypothetical protein